MTIRVGVIRGGMALYQGGVSRRASCGVSPSINSTPIQRAEIPTLACGPGSIDQAHQPDEFIEIPQLEAALAFLRRLAAELSSCRMTSDGNAHAFPSELPLFGINPIDENMYFFVTL